MHDSNVFIYNHAMLVRSPLYVVYYYLFSTSVPITVSPSLPILKVVVWKYINLCSGWSGLVLISYAFRFWKLSLHIVYFNKKSMSSITSFSRLYSFIWCFAVTEVKVSDFCEKCFYSWPVIHCLSTFSVDNHTYLLEVTVPFSGRLL